MPLFSLRLNPQEEILAIIRRHPSTFFSDFFRFLIMVAVIVSFHLFMPDFSHKMIVTGALAILAVLHLGYRFLVWYLVNIVVTTERVVDINQTSLSKRIVTEVALADIGQISCYKESLGQNLFNVGSLVLEVKGGGKIVAHRIKSPEELMNKLNQLRSEAYDPVPSSMEAPAGR